MSIESVLPHEVSLERLYDTANLTARHQVLTRFSEQAPIRFFVNQARHGNIRKAKPVALNVLVEVKPVEKARFNLPGHLQCEVTTSETQAWSLGTIGTDDHQLHITAAGQVMSLTNHLTYGGKTVINTKNEWPIKVLVAFDVSTLDEDSVMTLLERIHRLCCSEHH